MWGLATQAVDERCLRVKNLSSCLKFNENTLQHCESCFLRKTVLYRVSQTIEYT